MPHDKNGKLLQVGDTVTLTGKVTSVQANDDYCNVTVQSPYLPPKQMGFTVTCCTQETELVDESLPPIAEAP